MQYQQKGTNEVEWNCYTFPSGEKKEDGGQNNVHTV